MTRQAKVETTRRNYPATTTTGCVDSARNQTMASGNAITSIPVALTVAKLVMQTTSVCKCKTSKAEMVIATTVNNTRESGRKTTMMVQ
jgi:hypothetical protein